MNRLPLPISVKDLLTGRCILMEDLRAGKAVSRRYRNRRIGEFLKELELTEGRSTGIPKIIRKMKANGSPPPEFESDEERLSFLIRLPIHEKAILEEKGKGFSDETPQVTPQVAPQVRRLLEVVEGETSRADLMAALELKDRMHFSKEFLQPALSAGYLKYTIPDKPNSRLQKYRLTEKGLKLIKLSKG